MVAVYPGWGTVRRMPQPKKSAPAKKPAAKRKSAAKRAEPKAAQPKTSTETPAATEAADAAREDALKQNLVQLRELLGSGVVLTPQRLQETLDEAVTRGRMVRQDAEELTRSLLAVGRQQTQELLGEVEGLLRGGPIGAGSDLALQQVDKARRILGAGPTFPILGYDELAAAQVTKRLKDLSAAELRKVRDYERRNANRVSVLKAIEQRLAGEEQ